MSHPALIPAVITYDPVLRWPISTGPGLRKQQGAPIESQASVVGGPRPHGACAGVTGGRNCNGTTSGSIVFPTELEIVMPPPTACRPQHTSSSMHGGGEPWCREINITSLHDRDHKHRLAEATLCCRCKMHCGNKRTTTTKKSI